MSGMNIAEVRKLENVSPATSLEEIAGMLDRLPERLNIGILNWSGYDYKPEVKVAIAYGDSEIYLRYYVAEDYLKA